MKIDSKLREDVFRFLFTFVRSSPFNFIVCHFLHQNVSCHLLVTIICYAYFLRSMSFFIFLDNLSLITYYAHKIQFFSTVSLLKINYEYYLHVPKAAIPNLRPKMCRILCTLEWTYIPPITNLTDDKFIPKRRVKFLYRFIFWRWKNIMSKIV